jgi:UDP-N-acetylglucosamine 2-epimerase
MMLAKIEEVILAVQPQWVLVYGDTNSTLAGALAASKLHIPVAHIEAGLRSLNRAMPEEINRVVADHLSDLLFCPTQTAIDNLAREGVTSGVHLVGDVMLDTLQRTVERARLRSTILEQLNVQPREYILATVHRAENTDNPERLRCIIEAFAEIEDRIIFPVHPRTRKTLEHLDVQGVSSARVQWISPLGYLDMVRLTESARLILTDSGGVQKEAYWLGVPCLTLRDETEWVETVQAGWNILVGADTQRIIKAAHSFTSPVNRPPLFGDGKTAEAIVEILSHSNY